ncbi:MAG: hypothetical protein H6747_09555 [Deltaproteobacteria bacterium]|nr:hypothetical protein [Deltaproteobacteria bacterium]
MEIIDMTDDQIDECRETIRRCHVQLDRTRELLAARQPDRSRCSDLPAADPIEVEQWLQTGRWSVLRRAAAVALLLLTLGCSAAETRTGPCRWHASAVVVGKDGRPSVEASGKCSGTAWGWMPVEGEVKCRASVGLPSGVTVGGAR